MDTYQAMLLDIPQSEISRVYQDGSYTRWSYFVDAEAAVVGVIYANDQTLAMYHLTNKTMLVLGPLGFVTLANAQYAPDNQQLHIAYNGSYVSLSVFNDLTTVGAEGMKSTYDFSVVKQWQDFLASKGVQTAASPQNFKGTPSSRWIAIAAAIIATIFSIFTLISRQ